MGLCLLEVGSEIQGWKWRVIHKDSYTDLRYSYLAYNFHWPKRTKDCSLGRGYKDCGP